MTSTRRQFLQAAAVATAGPAFIPQAMANAFNLKQFASEVAELVSIDSKSGYEEGSNKIIDIFAKRFRSIGWTVSTPYCKGRGDALVATSHKNQDRYDVVLCAHSDTVQPVGNAAKYPFRLDGHKAYGAGVADDKSSLNAVWWICKDLPKRVTDKLNIAVIINPGEESGSDASRAFMADQAKKTPLALVYEPGRGEVPGPHPHRVRQSPLQHHHPCADEAGGDPLSHLLHGDDPAGGCPAAVRPSGLCRRRVLLPVPPVPHGGGSAL